MKIKSTRHVMTYREFFNNKRVEENVINGKYIGVDSDTNREDFDFDKLVQVSIPPQMADIIDTQRPDPVSLSQVQVFPKLDY